jgi:hypothetical protein
LTGEVYQMDTNPQKRNLHLDTNITEEEEKQLIHKNKTLKLLRQFRKRLKYLENRKLICPYLICQKRQFLSKQRYDLHMKFHQLKDEEEKQRKEAERKEFNRRKDIIIHHEKNVLENIRRVREGYSRNNECVADYLNSCDDIDMHDDNEMNSGSFICAIGVFVFCT